MFARLLSGEGVQKMLRTQELLGNISSILLLLLLFSGEKADELF